MVEVVVTFVVERVVVVVGFVVEIGLVVVGFVVEIGLVVVVVVEIGFVVVEDSFEVVVVVVVCNRSVHAKQAGYRWTDRRPIRPATLNSHCSLLRACRYSSNGILGGAEILSCWILR